MADDLDADELLMLLDQAEADGWPPHLVERLRALVRAEAWGWDGECSVPPSQVVWVGDTILRGQFVRFEQDERIYPAHAGSGVAGAAVRSLLVGQLVRWDPIALEFG